MGVLAPLYHFEHIDCVLPYGDYLVVIAETSDQTKRLYLLNGEDLQQVKSMALPEAAYELQQAQDYLAVRLDQEIRVIRGVDVDHYRSLAWKHALLRFGLNRQGDVLGISQTDIIRSNH